MIKLLLRQMYGLLWKNILIKLRHYIFTLIEFVIPVFLSLILAWVLSKPSKSRWDDKGIVNPPTADSKSYFNSRDPNLGKVFCFSPNNSQVYEIMNNVLQLIANLRGIDLSSDKEYKFLPFPDEAAIDKFMTTLHVSDKENGRCIVFTDTSAWNRTSGDLRYIIKQRGKREDSSLWDMSYQVYGPKFDFPKDSEKYQYIINKALLMKRAEKFNLPMVDYQMNIFNFPYPSYISRQSSDFEYLLSHFFPWIFIIIFPLMVHRVCSEKASMSREMLKMSGLTDAAYWTSNIAFYLIFFAFNCIILIISLKIPFIERAPWCESSFFLLFIAFFLYSLLLILSGMIFTVVIQKPSVCTTVAVLWFFMSLAIDLIAGNEVTGPVIPIGTWKWLCLTPNVAAILMMKITFTLEAKKSGLTFATIGEAIDKYDGLTFGDVLVSILLSILMHAILLWYLDAVWPWQPGVAKPFYFFLTKRYWMPGAQNSEDLAMQVIRDRDVNERKSSSLFEEIEGRPVAIECRGLSKTFSSLLQSERKVAVDGVNLNVYHGEITCLLGHNGAGKTTTMNMITGMFPPSSGSISVNGYDLSTDTARARSSMCLCPQHNPLYDELTVRQHLFLYSCVKGYPLDRMNEEIENALQLTGMRENAEKRPKELSGGMKRKLCLGMALVGGSQILILDEPSSGLDTEARRFMWDSLKKIRESKTILLTTHDMEEADALADRIAIMHDGHVVCSGSSMFLKKKLGTGYSLSISKGIYFQAEATFDLMREFLPKATVKVDIGSEITYQLKEDKKSKHHISLFFRELEAQSEALGINSFGVSVSSLEDVFFKIGEASAGHATSESTGEEKPYRPVLTEDQLRAPRKEGASLLMSQFVGLFLKRFHHAKRSWRSLILQIVLPCIILSLGFSIVHRLKSLSSFDESIVISLKLYPETKVYIQTNGPSSQKLVDNLKVIINKAGNEIVTVDKDVNMTQYFLNEAKTVLITRYLRSHVVGISVRDVGEKRHIQAWVNAPARISLIVAIDLIQKAQSLEQLRHDASLADSNDEHLLMTYQWVDEHVSTVPVLPASLKSIPWILFIPLSVCFLSSSYIVFPVHEKSSKAKLIQLMTGLNPILFHVASVVFDMTSHLVTSLLVIILIAILDTDKNFISNASNTFALLLLLMAFGFSSVAICYLLSYLFSSDSRAYIVVLIINFITGLILSLVIFIFSMTRKFHETGIYDKVKIFSQISPVSSITSGFFKIYVNNIERRACKTLNPEELRACTYTQEFIMFDSKLPCCPNLCRSEKFGYDRCAYDSPFGWSDNRVLSELLSMFLVSITVLSIIFLYEFFGSQIHRLFSSLRSLPDRQFADSDVQEEEARVQALIAYGSVGEEALTVYQLYKRFNKVYAVRGISFAVHQQECFGLLGVNGAGKSTTFGMLTGDIAPQYGDVYQGELNLSSDRSLYQQNLGYCPQFNPIIDNMTGREMIFLLARLRGVPKDSLSALCDEMINLVDLEANASKLSGTLSGGNKRKLSIALAMIGNPKIVLLDEPTAGVDPGARRKIWTTLSFIRERMNCSMILTSHSMNECEALCSRMGIMVRGEFICLGSAQHLKSKFGRGYTAVMKMKPTPACDSGYVDHLAKRIAKVFRGATLMDQHDTMLVYRIPKSTGSLADVFDAMDKLRKELDLADYTLSNTSLEQVFIHFAKATQSQQP